MRSTFIEILAASMSKRPTREGMSDAISEMRAEIERLRAEVRRLEDAIRTVRQLRALEARDGY